MSDITRSAPVFLVKPDAGCSPAGGARKFLGGMLGGGVSMSHV